MLTYRRPRFRSQDEHDQGEGFEVAGGYVDAAANQTLGLGS
jgi:hypothetical protein